jgi:HlyD family secretion protein
MTASATIFVEEKKNTLTIAGKAVRFAPDQAYLMKMLTKMKAGGSMPSMPARAPAGAGMPNMASGQPMTGMPAGMSPGMMNVDPKSKTVWLKDEKTGLRPNMIKTGIDNGSSIEIISGLKEGDEVIISMGNSTAKNTAKKADNGPPGGFPF